MTPRDAGSDINNLAYPLNLSEPDAIVATLPVPKAPLLAAPCLKNVLGGFPTSGASSPATEWQQLGQVAASAGYLVKHIT